MKVKPKPTDLTYASVGVDRKSREKSRKTIAETLEEDVGHYRNGHPLKLPFNTLFPVSKGSSNYLDLQIEGIGTKTLVAELARRYDTIGIDAVAMVVNDVLRSGALPVLISDGIHISESEKKIVNDLIAGVRTAARESECVLSSGETGDVPEILHERKEEGGMPFDMMASCLGIAHRDEVISGKIGHGDQIIGLASSGIHSNGLTLARKVLLKPWGGKFDLWATPNPLKRPLANELLEPTRIYARPLKAVRRIVEVKSAIHITGDGFGKFRRLLDWQKTSRRRSANFGFRFALKRDPPEIFSLLMETSRSMGSPIPIAEMFRTFNMGFGFAIVVPKGPVDDALGILNKYCPAEVIGTVSEDGLISVSTGMSPKAVQL